MWREKVCIFNIHSKCRFTLHFPPHWCNISINMIIVYIFSQIQWTHTYTEKVGMGIYITHKQIILDIIVLRDRTTFWSWKPCHTFFIPQCCIYSYSKRSMCANQKVYSSHITTYTLYYIDTSASYKKDGSNIVLTAYNVIIDKCVVCMLRIFEKRELWIQCFLHITFLVVSVFPVMKIWTVA